MRRPGRLGEVLAILSPLVASAVAIGSARMLVDYPQFIPGILTKHQVLFLSRWFANEWNWLWITLAFCGASVAARMIGTALGRPRASARIGIGWANAWWLLPVAVQCLSLLALASETNLVPVIVLVVPAAWILGVAGWLAGHWQVAVPEALTDRPKLSFGIVAIAVLVYVGLFSTLSILQYRALHVPHGDTGMYEEHLWNTLQGKGFRSQLDDGRLFLGEHIQFVHLVLLPVYWLAPSLETLNVLQSLALGIGAIPVYWVGRRLGLSGRAAGTLAVAYLLYFPLQYLNLEASWKTFRPTTFGIPLVLFALAALESHRLWLMIALLGLALTAKEEYALVAAALGVYLSCRRGRGPRGRLEIPIGIGLFLASLLFLWLTLSVLIPYFRAGAAPHYTPYFKGLGESTSEQIRTVLTQPLLVLRRVTSLDDWQFLLWMLLPLGFVPLTSPGRFLVAAPIFGYLMLGDLESLTQPWFHFHAPLVPLLWWATVGGVVNLRCCRVPEHLARWICCLALLTGVAYGRSPLSVAFWDPARAMPRRFDPPLVLFEPRGAYWKDLYVPGERSRAFEHAFAHIEPDERVAATDYVRSRFTHHRAAHDYPTLRGHVTIDDIDVIVLDKTEGWWGRGDENPDRELLQVMRDQSVPGEGTIGVRGRPFRIVHHDPFFLVVRRDRTVNGERH
ncbi:DUF2079 domain-containing protein [Kolteria novifilia]|uniref:DUF2079 domain-containing protein n=1 Tax=Kolteria novifilia TaxID=2527975 RepID=UPI003AF36E8A